MDDGDRAQAYAELERELALRDWKSRDGYGEVQIVTTDGVICCDCGAPIGGERLGAVPNAVRCVGCQEVREAEDKRYE